MLFFSICISILNIGDIATLEKIWKKFLTRYLMLTPVILGLTLGLVSWLFPVSLGGSDETAGFQALLAMLFAVVPSDMLSPFLNGNVLQIIFFGGYFCCWVTVGIWQGAS